MTAVRSYAVPMTKTAHEMAADCRRQATELLRIAYLLDNDKQQPASFDPIKELSAATTTSGTVEDAFIEYSKCVEDDLAYLDLAYLGGLEGDDPETDPLPAEGW